MTSSTRTLFTLLLFLTIFLVSDSAKAGPADDLLPPPERQAEKRTLGGNEERAGNRYYDGNASAGAAFSPDGKLLVTRSDRNQGLALWDVGTNRQVGLLDNQSQYGEGLLTAFTPDGKQLIGAGRGGHQEGNPVWVWDVAKRERLRNLDENVNDSPFSALAMAPDGKTIALAAAAGRRNEEGLRIVFWDLASGDEVGRIDGLITVQKVRNQVSHDFTALAYSPDGRSLAVLFEERVLLVELATGKLRGEMTIPTVSRGPAERQVAMLGTLAFAPEGRTLCVGCLDGSIRRFSLLGGRELTPLTGHKGPVLALCWTLDGKRLQSFGQDGQFFSWRTDSGREWQPKAGQMSDAALETLWDILRGDDPRDLFGCVQTLAANPDQAVPFLRKRLAPVPKADVEGMDRLITDLQKGDYNARKRAAREIRKIGMPAAHALRLSQEKGNYDGLTNRLLNEFDNQAPTPDQVRAVRALSVLERVGNTAARELLEQLAGGSAEAALTIQAKAVLDRLGNVESAKSAPAPEALWEALASEDSTTAYRAMRTLAQRPSSADFLRDRLKEFISQDALNDDPERVAKLIGNLNSDAFDVREKASKSLRNLGRIVVPSLRKAKEGNPDLEAKRRLDKLLQEAENAPPSPEMLRLGRALETLELTSGTEATQALEALVKDVRIQWLRDAVAESLRRQRAGNRQE